MTSALKVAPVLYSATPLNVEQELKRVVFAFKTTHSSTKTQILNGNIKNKPTI
jgi:hypothetical protein